MSALTRAKNLIHACRLLTKLRPDASRTLTNPRGCTCQYSSKPETSEEPIKFSQSEAAVGGSVRPRNKRDAPWFEAPIIMASLSAFMLYFCIFREENDLDDEMRVSLFDRLPGMERNQLEVTIEYNKDRGIDTQKLETRLQELDKEKS